MTTKPTKPAAGTASLKVMAENTANPNVAKSIPKIRVNPAVIEMEPGFNGRPIDLAHVAEMELAAKDGATFPDLVVRVDNGRILLIDGHHRLTMYLNMIAGGAEIPFVTCEEYKGNDAERTMLMIASAGGLALTPLQLGAQYKKMVDVFGWSYARVAARRGKTSQHVKDMIELANSDTVVHQAIERGDIAASQALKVVRSAKQDGTNAGATIVAARAAAPAGKPLTQRVLDKLGVSKVKEVAKASDVTREHLKSMLDSPSFTATDKSVIGDVIALLNGVKLSPAAQGANGRVWLQGIVNNSKSKRIQKAALFLQSHLDVSDVDRDDTPPSLMSLADAVKTERDSGGAVLAQDLCPEHAELIAWLRVGAGE